MKSGNKGIDVHKVSFLIGPHQGLCCSPAYNFVPDVNLICKNQGARGYYYAYCAYGNYSDYYDYNNFISLFLLLIKYFHIMFIIFVF